EPPIVSSIDRGRQISLHVEQWVDHTLAVADDTDVEIPLPERLKPGTGRHHALCHMKADLAPVVDDPGRIVFVRLVDIAVEQLEAEPFGPCVFQQASRLCPRFFDVGPPAGDLLQLSLGCGERRSREDNASDGVDVGEFGKLRCRIPTVDREAKRTANADIVKWLFLVVDLDKAAAVPVGLLHRDLVAELLLLLLDSRWRIAAKLDCGPVAADRVDLDSLFWRIDPDKAI